MWFFLCILVSFICFLLAWFGVHPDWHLELLAHTIFVFSFLLWPGGWWFNRPGPG